MQSQIKRLFSLILLIALQNPAQAEVWIQEVQSVAFPKVLSTGTGNSKIIVEYSGQLGSGTNATIVGANFNAGEYLLTSDTSNTFSINIVSDQNVSGVTLKTFKFHYEGITYKNFPVSGLPSPGSGKTAQLGLLVQYNASVGIGEVLPSFTITVSEDL